MGRQDISKGDQDFAAFVGIDWADEKHEACLMEAGEGKRERMEVQQTAEAIAEWVGRLRTRFAGKKIAVCLEQSKGALIYALMVHDFLVLFPVNPLVLSNYREAFHPSGAKDDQTDAELLAELVAKHRTRLKAWQPDDERTRSITILGEARRNAVNERTRLSNRLKSLLKCFFPQALQLVGEDLHTVMACKFLAKWPTLQDVKRAKEETIRDFYCAHNMRRKDVLDKRLELINEAKPLTDDKAVIETSVITVGMLANQLLGLTKAIGEYDRKLEELFPGHPDAGIFSSFPGAGTALAPRLLAAFGSDRNRYDSASEMQRFSGIAPVTERSGKSLWVHWRWSCSKFIRQSFHEFANQSRHYSLWACAYYEQQRERGKGHHAAIRALAFKWIRIIYRCWKERTPYDEQIYLNALKKRGSSLLRYIAKNSEGNLAATAS